ncbi:MAG: class I SAM-dependent methyltransferase [archaeon]
MKFVIPKRELLVKSYIGDSVDLYYSKITPIRSIILSRVTKTLSLLNKKRYSKILEIGVGSGFTIPYLASISNKVYATDIHSLISKLEPLLRYCKINDKVVLKKCSAEKMPFKSKSFDAIIGISVLEHLKNPEIGIKEIKRVLKKEGEAVFGFPIESILNKILFKILELVKAHEPGDHKQHAAEIIQILEKYFVIEKIEDMPKFLPKSLRLYKMVRCRAKK